MGQLQNTPALYATSPEALVAQLIDAMQREGYVFRKDVPESLWTVEQCAEFLQIGEGRVRELCYEGLPHLIVNPGRERVQIRFHPESVSEWVKMKSTKI